MMNGNYAGLCLIFTAYPWSFVASVTITFNYGSLSPLVNDKTDDFDWSIRNTNTPSSNTGPSKGHTCSACSSDYYAFIETSSPRKLDDSAVIYYPVSFQPSKCVKVSFWYYGYGSTLGKLAVVAKHGSSSSWTEHAFASTLSYQQWRYKEVSVHPSNAQPSVMVGFKGVRGTDFYGDYAIDDIVITDCSSSSNAVIVAPVTIDFTSGSLSPLMDSTSDDFDWSTRRTSTPSSNTGPPKGHSCTYCSSDYYAFIETSSPRNQGDFAILYYPFTLRPSSCMKVSFWYYGYGSTLGKLAVVAQHPPSTAWREHLVVSTVSNQRWIYENTYIYPYSQSGVVVGFKGVRGSDFYGDYAIDDIAITDCDDTSLTTTTTSTSGGGSGATVPINFVEYGNTKEFYGYTHGDIYSRGYPDGYSYNDCKNQTWKITVQSDYEIQIQIKEFETSPNHVLTLYDMTRNSIQTLYSYWKVTSFSGRNFTSSVLDTNTHQLYLNFTCKKNYYYYNYNYNDNYKGFHLSWFLHDSMGNEVFKSNEAPGSSAPLSRSVYIGIGVGAGLLVVLLAVTCCCCCFCNQKTTVSSSTHTANGTDTGSRGQGYINQSYSSGQQMAMQAVYPTANYERPQQYSGQAPPAYATLQQGVGQPAYTGVAPSSNFAQTTQPTGGNIYPAPMGYSYNSPPAAGYGYRASPAYTNSGYTNTAYIHEPVAQNNADQQPSVTDVADPTGQTTSHLVPSRSESAPNAFQTVNNQSTRPLPSAPPSNGLPPVESLPPPPGYDEILSNTYSTPPEPAVYNAPPQMPTVSESTTK